MGTEARVVVVDRVRVVVTHDLLAREHPFGAYDLPESLQCPGHRLGAQAGREWFCHAGVPCL